MINQKKIILAVETGIGGGSSSLWVDGREVDGWTGNEKISRSEEILCAIDEILLKNRIDKNQIDLILINESPGSFTGIRIGSAILMALKNVLLAEFVSVSVLEAMSGGANNKSETISAVPVGNNMVAWLTSDAADKKEFHQERSQVFAEFLDQNREKHFIIQNGLTKFFNSSNNDLVTNIGNNLALTMIKNARASDNGNKY